MTSIDHHKVQKDVARIAHENRRGGFEIRRIIYAEGKPRLNCRG